MGWFYAVIISAAIAAGVFTVHTYNSTVERAKELEGKVAEYARAYNALGTYVQKQQFALNEAERLARVRAARAQEAEREQGRLQDELEAIKRRDPEAASWAATALPVNVRLSIATIWQRAVSAPAVPHTNGVNDADADSKLPSPGQRGSRLLPSEDGASSSAMQR